VLFIIPTVSCVIYDEEIPITTVVIDEIGQLHVELELWSIIGDGYFLSFEAILVSKDLFKSIDLFDRSL
jgi:hypothetical protein